MYVMRIDSTIRLSLVIMLAAIMVIIITAILVAKSYIDIVTTACLIGVASLLAVTAFLIATYKKNRFPSFPFLTKNLTLSSGSYGTPGLPMFSSTKLSCFIAVAIFLPKSVKQ